MSTITYLKEIPLMKKILAGLLMLSGIVIFFANIFLGVFAFVIGINLIATDGSEIDLERKVYRNVKSILGIKFGKWKPYPNFEYISIFKTKESTQVSAMGAQMATFKSDIILLNIFYDRNKHMTFYKTDDKADAFKVAGHFKLALNIDILDATGADKVWLT